MKDIDRESGFSKPREITDERIQDLYESYGLPRNASLEQLEPIAIRLLSDPNTLLTGINAVMGRSISAAELVSDEDRAILSTIFLQSGEVSFAVLLLQLGVEHGRNVKNEANG